MKMHLLCLAAWLVVPAGETAREPFFKSAKRERHTVLTFVEVDNRRRSCSFWHDHTYHRGKNSPEMVQVVEGRIPVGARNGSSGKSFTSEKKKAKAP